MLVLARKPGQRVIIGDGIIVEVVPRFPGDTANVRLGITAPKDVVIDREEVHEQRKTNPRPGSLVPTKCTAAP